MSSTPLEAAIQLEPDSPPSRSGALVASLPFDILHTLLDFVSPVDLLSLCNTCKDLYGHTTDDSIWKRACAPYGIRDFTRFGGLSPYTIYTRLLHPYGPLVGLWASNHPFNGSIMEFRSILGDEHEQGGIIGEVWAFPRSATPSDDPVLPQYIRVLKISFEAESTDHYVNRLETHSTDGEPQVRIFCDTSSAPNTPGRGPTLSMGTTSARHLASLIRLPDSTVAYHVQYYRRTVDLPEFPKLDSPWYRDPDDPVDAPCLPRIPETADCELDQSAIIKIFPAMRLPAIWVSPTAAAARPAISIRCPRNADCECALLRAAPIPFPILDPSPPRYYPLKRTILRGVDPRSSAWTLANLEGLWYGSYGPNGTECLYVSLATDQPQRPVAVATKITGDEHVPRGSTSWVLGDMDEGGADVRLEREQWANFRPDCPVPGRILTGVGVVAATGFMHSSVVKTSGAVISADEIQIHWMTLHDFRTYRRYKGREG